VISGIGHELEKTLRLAELSIEEPFADLPFDEFCARYLRIQNKDGDIVPLQLNRAQRELIDNMTGRDIVLKARQLGVSTVIQAWHFYQQMQGNYRTNTLCHDDDLTGTLRRMSDLFYSELPEKTQPPRKYANAKLTAYDTLKSESSIATVGGTGGKSGKKKGRGGSVNRIHGSEVAFWPNARGVMSAAMQAGNPDIILESTPNGMVGWFYEQCQAAIDGNSVWALHFFPWWYDEEYCIPLEDGETLTYAEDEHVLIDAHGLTAEQIKWRRNKIKEIPQDFPQEYPEDEHSCFLSSGKSFFGDTEHIYTAPLDVEPLPARRYVGGLDFAQTGDYLSLTILDTVELCQVDQLHINNLPWQEMRRQVSVMANKWDADIYGEGNSMGTTNIELLQSGEVLEDESRIEPVKIAIFWTTTASKPPLIQGLYHAMHESGLRLQPRAFQKQEMRAFISRQNANGHWQYMAGEGAHDDFVISLALGWYGISNPIKPSIQRTKTEGMYSSQERQQSTGGNRKQREGPRS
jgi:hypothetical protein